MAAPHRSWSRDGYTIDTDPARLDLGVVHGFLAASYWAAGIPRDVVERAVAGSLNFGLYRDGEAAGAGEQAGFARVVTDRATFAYLADVFVLEPHRSRGLSKWLMECVTAHPELQGLRRWVLLTRDAHGLYRKYGFADVANPERWMHRWDPDVYRRSGPPR